MATIATNMESTHKVGFKKLGGTRSSLSLLGFFNMLVPVDVNRKVENVVLYHTGRHKDHKLHEASWCGAWSAC